MKDETNTEHLGDGFYVHWTGWEYEIMVNDHRNLPVASLSPEGLEAFIRFAKRMEKK